MSNHENDNLLERAYYIKEVCEELALTIDFLIDENDLDQLNLIVCKAEAELAEAAFYGEDAI